MRHRSSPQPCLRVPDRTTHPAPSLSLRPTCGTASPDTRGPRRPARTTYRLHRPPGRRGPEPEEARRRPSRAPAFAQQERTQRAPVRRRRALVRRRRAQPEQLHQASRQVPHRTTHLPPSPSLRPTCGTASPDTRGPRRPARTTYPLWRPRVLPPRPMLRQREEQMVAVRSRPCLLRLPPARRQPALPVRSRRAFRPAHHRTTHPAPSLSHRRSDARASRACRAPRRLARATCRPSLRESRAAPPAGPRSRRQSPAPRAPVPTVAPPESAQV